LFAERARSLAADESVAVEDVCRRLDGIPLAIELAASRMESMTATEVRDRLDHRFKLLIGSRRGLERHQTLRHAVAWSYDLLDDAEKKLLNRCSVFSGGMDLDGACAVMEPDADRFQVMDRLDALVRKSLVVAQHSSGRTRFSMLETIREFAEEQLVNEGGAAETRDAHARYFAGREADVMALWDSARQRDAYVWFGAELANLRTAFRWAADHDQLDPAAQIATYAGVLGMALENSEPSAWAEELIEVARLRDHPRLGFLYVVSALCWMAGRIDDAIAYSDKRQEMVRIGCGEVPFGLDGLLGGTYMVIGELEKALEWEDRYLDHRSDPLAISRSNRILQLVMAGRIDKAVAAVPEVLSAAEATDNPYAISGALLAVGFAFRDVELDKALDAMRRGLIIAHDSGNRAAEGYLASNIGRLEARNGDWASALDHLTLTLRINRDSGSITAIRSPLAIVVGILTEFRRYEQAATVAGFAMSALTATAFPELSATVSRLRHVLGADVHESLLRRGETMTTSAIASYALDQIEQMRAELNQLR
jgi:tetratricopeptide (TPR) repeat protein